MTTIANSIYIFGLTIAILCALAALSLCFPSDDGMERRLAAFGKMVLFTLVVFAIATFGAMVSAGEIS